MPRRGPRHSTAGLRALITSPFCTSHQRRRGEFERAFSHGQMRRFAPLQLQI
jgi:hypothetical protein